MIVAEAPKSKQIALLPLDDYDHYIVSFSGGKDSLACLLLLMERVGPDNYHKIELWHQHVDGAPGQQENFQD